MSDTDQTFDPWKDLDTDAVHWANAFVTVWHDARPDTETMVGWFANAIEIGRTAEAARCRKAHGSIDAAMAKP